MYTEKVAKYVADKGISIKKNIGTNRYSLYFAL